MSTINMLEIRGYFSLVFVGMFIIIDMHPAFIVLSFIVSFMCLSYVMYFALMKKSEKIIRSSTHLLT